MAKLSRREDSGGVWRGEIHCSDCGAVTITNERARGPYDPHPKFPQRCSGYYNGRKRNRCGWWLTWVWMFTPPEKLR